MEYIETLAKSLDLQATKIIERQQLLTSGSNSTDAHNLLIVGIRAGFQMESELDRYPVPTIEALRAKRKLRQAVDSSLVLLKELGI